MDKLCEKVWFDGQFVDWDDATIHVSAHVIHYGSGVFEGIRAYNVDGKANVFRLDEHNRRLHDSAKIYRMDIPFSIDETREAMIETIRVNEFDECYIRPVVFRNAGPMGVYPAKNPVSMFIMVWKWGKYLGPEALEQGVDMAISSWTRNAPNTTPAFAKCSANYASGALIKMDAIANGYSEGIALDVNGLVAEGSGENLFVIRDGVIHTPPIGNSILGGITRDSIITLAREEGIEVRETAMPREFLYIADEIFGVGTAAEVTPIRSLDKIKIGSGKRGPVTAKLQKKYLDVVQGRIADKWGWRTVVEPAAVAGRR
ncbi:MAG: branched-chain amino acid transaminase [Planctomycetes bacterium]|nr:branched-chain amino acid transaminase [Planctomycetota bacterium]NUQ33670.1 branched-chain amino acid transaminase [Planctomycetaceae bacterium]